MITLERAKKWDIPRVWLLYQRAFPAGERKPFSIILSMAKEGRTDLWVIRRDGRFAGLASTVNSPDMVLLDYFAVKKSLRGQGVGSAAMKAILDRYAPRGVLVEIESTRIPSGNAEERESRKRFYVNCGMTPLGTEVNLFGIRMELLGCRCNLDFAGYKDFYVRYYTSRAEKYVQPVREEP
jgi:GNAT superfamily N-acetyltransferase